MGKQRDGGKQQQEGQAQQGVMGPEFFWKVMPQKAMGKATAEVDEQGQKQQMDEKAGGFVDPMGKGDESGFREEKEEGTESVAEDDEGHGAGEQRHGLQGTGLAFGGEKSSGEQAGPKHADAGAGGINPDELLLESKENALAFDGQGDALQEPGGNFSGGKAHGVTGVKVERRNEGK